MTWTLFVDRLLAAPGRGPAERNVNLEIAGGRIAGISRSDRGRGSGGRLALPAMVNAHDHGYGLRPLALGGVDDALECWIVSLIRPTAEPRLEAAVAFGRMALAGVGATVHCHNSLVADRLEAEADGVARAAADVGIRVAFSCPVRDRSPWVYGDQRALLPYLAAADRAAMEAAILDGAAIPDGATIPGGIPATRQVEQVEAIAAAHESELFQVQYGPIGPQWCQDATLERIAAASAENDRRVHMHLLESSRQRQWLDATYRQGIVRFLDDVGLLSPRLTVAHGVHLTEEECALLAERGVTVAVNTSSNLRMRSGFAPLDRYMRHGLRFGFGLDGAAHDDDQDCFRDLRLAWRLHNGAGLDQALPPARLFEAAHAHGFRSIDGSDDYGAVVPGARADLVVLDYAAMCEDFLVADLDETDVLLTRATSRHVRELLVAGRKVVSDGALAGLDLPAAEGELMDRARRVAAITPGQLAGRQRLREAVRACYADGRHLEGGAVDPSP